MTTPKFLELVCTRRDAICGGSTAVAGIALSSLAGCGPAASLPQDVVVDVATHPQLSKDGGLYAVPPADSGAPVNIWVYRQAKNDFIAFSGKCPHQGCDVGNPNSFGFTCPCHGSQFTRDGTVTRGPAMRDLPRYDTSLDGTKLTIISAG